MQLFEQKKLTTRPGSFGAKVTKGKLGVPPEIMEILVSMNLGTAESFFEALYDPRLQTRFQETLGEKLGWSVSDFMAAAFELGPVLDGHIADRLLYPCGRPAARAPKKRRGRIRVEVGV